MESVIIQRAALGEWASLGDLYDARTDCFCLKSLFLEDIPVEAVTTTTIFKQDHHILSNETFEEKFLAFEVNAELQASVLTSLRAPEGAGCYLPNVNSPEYAIKTSIHFNVKTKHEILDVNKSGLQETFPSATIELGNATHIVVGISWGANSVLSCLYPNADNSKYEEIKNIFMERMRQLVSNEDIAVSTKEKVNDELIQFEFIGDIDPEDHELPTTFDEAIVFLKDITHLVKTYNNRQGVPLTYHLLPLTVLRDFYEIPIELECAHEAVEEKSLAHLLQFFEEFATLLKHANNLNKISSHYKHCMKPNEVVKLTKWKTNFLTFKEKLKGNLANCLADVRSGSTNSEQLGKIIQKYKNDKNFSEKSSSNNTEWKSLIERVQRAKLFSEHDINYVGTDHPLDFKTQEEVLPKTFALYFNEEEILAKPEVWKKNITLFIDKSKQGGIYKFYAVDCDIHPKLLPLHGICIQVVEGRTIISEDLANEEEQTENFANSTEPMQLMVNRPRTRGLLNIPCTGHNCKADVYYEWKCLKCKQVIEYGYDSYFYCICGRGRAGSYEFRCSDADHGNAFRKHSQAYLMQHLYELPPLKEMNILILGETGVGKSTWINGFMNYLSYDSLQEAEENELCTLIPSEFTVCDEDYNEIIVSTGTDANENIVSGQSATQDCQVYPFTIGDTIIRIIDTPGIGDTRGLEQDKANFQNILDTLSNLEELHGVCILLKPNNARLTVMFRFCIKELLTYLHKDASRNIMFCFTNSRGTSYKPGETLPALRNLLKDNKEVEILLNARTLYCYDTESYRFLAAVKNKTPVKFSEEDRENNIKSWTKSIAETRRMIEYISSLTPHPIKSTINLNHARELVIKLTRPLAEISKTIQQTKETVKSNLKDIMDTEENIKDLQKRAFYTKVVMETVHLPYPRTVCSNSECTEITGPSGNKEIKYLSVCHNQCEKKSSSSNSNKKGYFCSGMNMLGKCKTCGHSYKEHIRIAYERKEVLKQVEDENVKQLLNEDMTAAEMKQKMVEENRKLMDEYDFELRQIESAAVKFASFLKNNAITPYNDTMLEYMDHLIKEEKNKVASGGNKNTLHSLQERREAYVNEINALEQKIAKGESDGVIKSSVEVENIAQKLYTLKHNGKSLQEALHALNESEQRVHAYREVTASFRTNKKKRRKLRTIFDSKHSQHSHRSKSPSSQKSMQASSLLHAGNTNKVSKQRSIRSRQISQ